jgi:hypothetical protein
LSDGVRGVAALSGTGAPLSAAGARPGGEAPGVGGAGAAPAAPVVAAEYAGVRVLGPLQWLTVGEEPGGSGTAHNGGADTRTMVVTLFLLDARGQRLGSVEMVLWDLLPGEVRPFAQALPSLPAPPTDVSVRLEPLVP